MPAFVEKFSTEQREAAAEYRLDRALTASKVAELAKAGELTYRGKKVGPFEITPSYIADLGKKLEKRRRGQSPSRIAEVEHRDAIESLRRAAVTEAERLLRAFQAKAVKDPDNADPKRLGEIIKTIQLAAALPDRNDPRPSVPGARVNGVKQGSEIRGGLAGALLKANAAKPSTNDTKQDTEDGEHSEAEPEAHEAEQTRTDEQPGSLPSGRVEAFST